MKMSNTEVLVLSIPEVAGELNICAGSVNNLIRSGALKSLKIRDRRFVRKADLERFLDQAAEAAA